MYGLLSVSVRAIARSTTSGVSVLTVAEFMVLPLLSTSATVKAFLSTCRAVSTKQTLCFSLQMVRSRQAPLASLSGSLFHSEFAEKMST